MMYEEGQLQYPLVITVDAALPSPGKSNMHASFALTLADGLAPYQQHTHVTFCSFDACFETEHL